MRSIFFVLSAYGAVSHASECQAADETALLQGRSLVRLKTAKKDSKAVLKSLRDVANSLTEGSDTTVSPDEVNNALETANDALAGLAPVIRQQVEAAQQQITHASAALQACHAQGEADVRASLLEAVEQHADAVESCEDALQEAIEAEEEACQRAEDCLCDEARTHESDQEDLCDARTDTYEIAFCEHDLACNVFHQCHASETEVYHALREDVEAELAVIRQEYITVEQSACLTALIMEAMTRGTPISHAALIACDDVDVSALAINFPELPAQPAACPEPTFGAPQCGMHVMVDGCLNQNLEVDRAVVAHNSGATASVRCCSEAGDSCDSDHLEGGCQSGKTFTEAVAICAANGERLCTEDEIISRLCCGTGCNFDGHQVWVAPRFVNVDHLDHGPAPAPAGPWTLVVQYGSGSYPANSGAVGTPSETEAGAAKLSDADINALPAGGAGAYTYYKLTSDSATSGSTDSIILRTTGTFDDLHPSYGLQAGWAVCLNSATSVASCTQWSQRNPNNRLDTLPTTFPDGNDCDRWFTGYNGIMCYRSPGVSQSRDHHCWSHGNACSLGSHANRLNFKMYKCTGDC